MHTEITAKKKKLDFEIEFNQDELNKMLDPSSIQQEILRMRHKGVSPHQRQMHQAVASTEVTADVVEAVRWLDKIGDQLNQMKIQDIEQKKPWVEELLEDLMTHDVAISHTKEEAKVILQELDKELKSKMEAGFGPEARNYIFSLKRELEVVIEKL